MKDGKLSITVLMLLIGGLPSSFGYALFSKSKPTSFTKNRISLSSSSSSSSSRLNVFPANSYLDSLEETEEFPAAGIFSVTSSYLNMLKRNNRPSAAKSTSTSKTSSPMTLYLETLKNAAALPRTRPAVMVTRAPKIIKIERPLEDDTLTIYRSPRSRARSSAIVKRRPRPLLTLVAGGAIKSVLLSLWEKWNNKDSYYG